MAHVPGTFYWYLNDSSMGYPILRGTPQGDALVVLDDQNCTDYLPLSNSLGLPSVSISKTQKLSVRVRGLV